MRRLARRPRRAAATGLQRDRAGQVPLAIERLQLHAVAVQHGGVDLEFLGRTDAVDAEVHLDRAAADALPHDRLDLRLQRAVAFAGADRQLEVTAVDGADLDRHGHAVALAMRLAETGHAQEHVMQLLAQEVAQLAWPRARSSAGSDASQPAGAQRRPAGTAPPLAHLPAAAGLAGLASRSAGAAARRRRLLAAEAPDVAERPCSRAAPTCVPAT